MTLPVKMKRADLIARDRLFVPYLPIPVLFTLSGTAIFVDCLDLPCTTADRLLFNYYGFFLLTTFRTFFFRSTFTHVSFPLFFFVAYDHPYSHFSATKASFKAGVNLFSSDHLPSLLGSVSGETGKRQPAASR